MVYIYILQLEQGKYYIGKTSNPDFRIEQHFQCGGAIWTKKYKPLNALEIIPDCDDYDEDKYTRIYMDKYGIDNVRGGSFCEVILDESTIQLLEKMSKTTQNRCFTCGIFGHFAKECKKCEDENIICTNQFSDHRISYEHNRANHFILTGLITKMVKIIALATRKYEERAINFIYDTKHYYFCGNNISELQNLSHLKIGRAHV